MPAYEKAKRKSGRYRGITRRWIVGSLLWTVLILIMGIFTVIYSLRENYYNYARFSLLRSIERVYAEVPTSSEQGELARERALRTLVQEFSEREKFELMTVDKEGVVLLTSSGFSYDRDEPLDDFFEAKVNSDRLASRTGLSLGGENVVSYTKLFPVPIRDQIAGIRMVTSLRQVDARIREVSYLLAAICTLILFFSVFSGGYFIRSIVLPIRRVGNTAKRMADGDYDVRIENKYNDEIGALCDIINEMAASLSEADRVKNDFISSVSHELRTPLTSIRGWGETLLATDSGDRETFRRGMNIINNETDRLALMVEDLLDFSRLQTGHISVELVPIDIVAELTEAVMTFEERAKGLGLKLIYEEFPESMAVMADRNRLRQVFSNIIDNAVKYTRRGDKVRVSAARERDFVVVRVEDTGLGIPKEDLGRISERYFRAKNSLVGSGIGLAVVKEIVELHSGTLTVESELGKGTAVSVAFPPLT